VVEFLPGPLTPQQSETLVLRIEQCFEQHGYGLWALELTGGEPLIGFAGLAPADELLPFAPAVELGWRLARPYWGLGLATEAATRAIEFAFGELQLPGLVAYTARRNHRSQRVMQRLRMRRDPAEDFEHPAVPAGDPLAPHVLYRLSAAGG
jgi:RimJ/RimL family protein N-acetyltransferase